MRMHRNSIGQNDVVCMSSGCLGNLYQKYDIAIHSGILDSVIVLSELWITQSGHINITCDGHWTCIISRHLSLGEGQKWLMVFAVWPQFIYSLCPHGTMTNIKPYYRVIGEKPCLSYCNSYNVHCTCAVSCDLCTWGPPKPLVAIFWRKIVHNSLCNFCRATITITGRS